jgi:hypothetical protein
MTVGIRLNYSTERRIKMTKRYYTWLSRRDRGVVSYFPGLEFKDDPDTEWIEGVLIPAIEPIALRKSKVIREMPITFWVSVRETARYRAEIFLFVTPPFPGSTIELALSRALESIKNGKVNAGREPIPQDALPCCQIFRGKIIKFYFTFEGWPGFVSPAVTWSDNEPQVGFLPIPQSDTLVEDMEARQLPVRADIQDISDGNFYRKYQQALSTIAHEEE